MTYQIPLFYHDAQMDFEMLHLLDVIYTVFLLHNKAFLTLAS
jgi:hypothetical protein